MAPLCSPRVQRVNRNITNTSSYKNKKLKLFSEEKYFSRLPLKNDNEINKTKPLEKFLEKTNRLKKEFKNSNHFISSIDTDLLINPKRILPKKLRDSTNSSNNYDENDEHQFINTIRPEDEKSPRIFSNNEIKRFNSFFDVSQNSFKTKNLESEISHYQGQQADIASKNVIDIGQYTPPLTFQQNTTQFSDNSIETNVMEIRKFSSFQQVDYNKKRSKLHKTMNSSTDNLYQNYNFINFNKRLSLDIVPDSDDDSNIHEEFMNIRITETEINQISPLISQCTPRSYSNCDNRSIISPLCHSDVNEITHSLMPTLAESSTNQLEDTKTFMKIESLKKNYMLKEKCITQDTNFRQSDCNHLKYPESKFEFPCLNTFDSKIIEKSVNSSVGNYLLSNFSSEYIPLDIKRHFESQKFSITKNFMEVFEIINEERMIEVVENIIQFLDRN